MKKLFIEMKLEVLRFYYYYISLEDLPSKYFTLEEIEEDNYWGEEEEIAWRKYKGRKSEV